MQGEEAVLSGRHCFPAASLAGKGVPGPIIATQIQYAHVISTNVSQGSYAAVHQCAFMSASRAGTRYRLDAAQTSEHHLCCHHVYTAKPHTCANNQGAIEGIWPRWP